MVKDNCKEINLDLIVKLGRIPKLPSMEEITSLETKLLGKSNRFAFRPSGKIYGTPAVYDSDSTSDSFSPYYRRYSLN